MTRLLFLYVMLLLPVLVAAVMLWANWPAIRQFAEDRRSRLRQIRRNRDLRNW